MIGENAVPERITSSSVKLTAIRTILHHYINQIPVTLDQNAVQNVAMWALRVKNITGRVHNPTPAWSEALGLPIKERHGLHYQDGAMVLNDLTEKQGQGDVDTTATASIHQQSSNKG